jgi:peptide/nickel transport system substrate-binding protein
MDPDYTARAHSKQIPAKYGVGSNYSQYENAEVDGLLELGVTQTDQAARKKTYARIQEILADEVPFAPQAGTYQGNLKKKQLTGIKPTGYTVNCAWNLYEWSWA